MKLLVIKLAQLLECLKTPLVFLLVFVALYILTFISIEFSIVPGGTYKHMYDVLRVFTLSANEFHLDTLHGSRNLGLMIMIWLDALFMVAGFLSLTTETLVRGVLARDVPDKEHIIVFGLGAWGLHYAKAISSSGGDVVVVEKEPRDDAIKEIVATWESSDVRRIYLIVGDCLDETVLRKAKFKTARKILPMLKNDGENINAAFFIRALRGQDKQVDEQVVLLPVDDVRLSTSLAKYKRFAEHANKIEIRFFNAMQQTAVRHLMKYPPELYAEIFGHSKVHFAIHGLSDMAINLIYVIGHLCHYCTWNINSMTKSDAKKTTFEKVMITVIDQDIEKARKEIAYLFPHIGQVLKIDYEKSAIIDGIAANHYFLPEGGSPVTQHFFCFRDETLSIRCAIKLRKQQMQSKRLNTPIFVRSKDGKGLTKLIDSNCGEKEWPDNIFPLVILSDELNDDIYFSDSIEKIAKSFNAGLFKKEESQINKEMWIQNKWGNLSSDFRHSSFFQAAYLRVRLRAIGYDWVVGRDSSPTTNTWNALESHLCTLGLLEHERYKSERWLLGWSEGERTLGDINRSHPELEEVGKNSRWMPEYDLEQAQQLPQLLNQAGCTLMKKQISGIEELDHLEMSNTPEIWFNLLDFSAREKIKEFLGQNGKDDKHSFYGLLPLPFELIKGIAELLEGEDAKTKLAMFVCGKDKCEKSDLIEDITKVAGMISTYIEIPLEIPFNAWLKENPDISLKYLERACDKANDIIDKRKNEPVSGNDLNLAEQGVCAKRVCKKPIPVQVSFAGTDGICKTKEGDVAYKAGEAILTGVEGEQWPVERAKFDTTYEPIAPTMKGEDGHYAKKPVTVYALQMYEPFYVNVSWSDDRLVGKPGDWLLQYGSDDYGVVSQSIFEETYDILQPEDEEE